jgi:hypothetical protein
MGSAGPSRLSFPRRRRGQTRRGATVCRFVRQNRLRPVVPLFHGLVRNRRRSPTVLAEDRSPSGRIALLRDCWGGHHACERHARQPGGCDRSLRVADHAGLVAHAQLARQAADLLESRVRSRTTARKRTGRRPPATRPRRRHGRNIGRRVGPVGRREQVIAPQRASRHPDAIVTGFRSIEIFAKKLL